MIATPAHPLESVLLQARLYHRAKDLAKAEELYRGILNARPDHLVAINDFGRVLQDQGKPDEAAAMFRRVIALRPDLAPAYRNLGVVLCENGRLEDSFAAFRRHAELAYGTPESSACDSKTIPPHKTLHDREQRYYLTRGNGFADDARMHGGHMFYIEDGNRVSGRAVNPDASCGDIEARWRNSRPQLVVIDNVLTGDALDRLRCFCWRSTVWRQSYAAGYLGAMPEHGLGSPLLAQIADELRSAYPAIFGRHPLLQFWGFKYDSRLGGVAVHADFAAINVNFWITPDDANLDPESGGLVIWDARAPKDWDFARYNDDVKSARAFLAHIGARATTVPYRSNRAVIFDSDLFHETDRIVFKEGYLNRRINITLLYGRRETPSPEGAEQN